MRRSLKPADCLTVRHGPRCGVGHYFFKMNFNEKVVIVTGAATGVGEDAAIEFAKLGAKVVLVDINEEQLKIVNEKIKSNMSPTTLVITADVSKDAVKIIDETIHHFRKLDILVSNAAVVREGFPSNLDLDTHDLVFAVNVRAVVELTKLAIPHLEKTKGNIINVTSVGGSVPHPYTTSYSMSKAALDMYTKCASLELAPRGVRVNGLSPGCIRTSLVRNMGLSEEDLKVWLDKAKERYPVGRIGEVSDTTNGILFLASEKSSFINGTLLVVDGGRTHI